MSICRLSGCVSQNHLVKLEEGFQSHTYIEQNRPISLFIHHMVLENLVVEGLGLFVSGRHNHFPLNVIDSGSPSPVEDMKE